MMSEKIYTPDEAAQIYNINAKSFRGWLRNKNYRQYQLGIHWHVPQSIIEEYLASKIGSYTSTTKTKLHQYFAVNSSMNLNITPASSRHDNVKDEHYVINLCDKILHRNWGQTVFMAPPQEPPIFEFWPPRFFPTQGAIPSIY